MKHYLPLQVLWDYMRIDDPLTTADCIVAFGSYNTDVARRSAQLYLEGYAPCLLMTGGLGRSTEGRWSAPEAEVFARIAMEMGVPEHAILIENQSTNTGENIRFSQALLRDRNIPVHKIIGVQKPYMGRRLYASLAKQWEGIDALITSPPLDMMDYIQRDRDHEISEEELIHIIMGDVERMKHYVAAGFQIHQDIPNAVWAAYHQLKAMGYGDEPSK